MPKSTPAPVIHSPVAALVCLMAACCAALCIDNVSRADEVLSTPGFEEAEGKFETRLHSQPFATYAYHDAEISRPYFANIRLPNGIQVTRNHPPAAGDAQDHARLHPGLWLAFGDISGHDYWRLRAPVEHVRFVEPPVMDGDRFRFAVENRYLPEDAEHEICREICRYEFALHGQGILVRWDSTFQSDDQDFYFGDQEEMGLGVRLATPIAVNSSLGGHILNSHGQRNEKEAWGQAAEWCDYGGTVNGRFVGVQFMPHPGNSRECWFHTRDYGFVAATLFGRRAFGAGERSQIFLRNGQPFSLRYGAHLRWNDRTQDFNPAAIYQR